MRPVSIDKIEPGAILAKTIHDESGKVLLASGTELKESYIKKLVKMKIPFIYLENELVKDLEVEEVIDDRTRINAQQITRRVMETTIQGGRFELKTVQGSIDQIIDEVLVAKGLINLIDFRTPDSYLFGHSVNVCVLSIMCGKSMGFNQLELKHLGLGALLHDLGMGKMDKQFRINNDDLSDQEWEQIKTHPKIGFDELRKFGDLSLLAAHCALQHHERWDGTGYPRNICGQDIHLYARIVAVADVFDALVSERPYRKRYQPHEAVEFIHSHGGIHFDPNVVTNFLANIAIYPMGSLIQLNTGEKGVVVDTNKSFPSRPVVKLVTDKTGGILRKFTEIDMVKHPSYFVKEVLDQANI